eukprot:gene14017-19953_t
MVQTEAERNNKRRGCTVERAQRMFDQSSDKKAKRRDTRQAHRDQDQTLKRNVLGYVTSTVVNEPSSSAYPGANSRTAHALEGATCVKSASGSQRRREYAGSASTAHTSPKAKSLETGNWRAAAADVSGAVVMHERLQLMIILVRPTHTA